MAPAQYLVLEFKTQLTNLTINVLKTTELLQYIKVTNEKGVPFYYQKKTGILNNSKKKGHLNEKFPNTSQIMHFHCKIYSKFDQYFLHRHPIKVFFFAHKIENNIAIEFSQRQ